MFPASYFPSSYFPGGYFPADGPDLVLPIEPPAPAGRKKQRRMDKLVSAYAFEDLSVTSASAVGFTETVFHPSEKVQPYLATVTVETAGIRYRYDGAGNPTGTSGHGAGAGETFTLYGPEDIRQFKAIATSTTADVKVTFSK